MGGFKIHALLHDISHRLFLCSQSKPCVNPSYELPSGTGKLYYMFNFYLCLSAHLTDTTCGNHGNHATQLFLLPQREPHREHNNDGNYRNCDVNQCGITCTEKILCTALHSSQKRTQN